MYDVCIIGGGASGMYASIILGKYGYNVVIVEANDRLGKKLLATGNGKCNLSNKNLDTSYYNHDIIKGILREYDSTKLCSDLLSLGLLTKEKLGRIYPYSEQSNSVLNVFLENIKKYNVKVEYESKVDKIIDKNDYYIVPIKNGTIKAKKVCFALGSNASFGIENNNFLKTFGINIIKNKCALSPLLVENKEDIKGLSGVRQEGQVSLILDNKKIYSEYGEVQFRGDSLSGIVMFNLSSKLARLNREKAEISIDFFPDYSLDKLEKMYSDSIMKNYGLLNKFLLQNIDKKGVEYLKDFRVKINVNKDIKQAQVASGGIDINEIDFSNMSLKKYKNLYALGECIDIDGLCGGYNLHWAFASGYIFAKGVINNATKIK